VLTAVLASFYITDVVRDVNALSAQGGVSETGSDGARHVRIGS